MKQDLALQVGQFVRVSIKGNFFSDSFRKRVDTTFEGLVTSVLFDKNFEVSYIEDEKPISHWFSINDIDELEVL